MASLTINDTEVYISIKVKESCGPPQLVVQPTLLTTLEANDAFDDLLTTTEYLSNNGQSHSTTCVGIHFCLCTCNATSDRITPANEF